MCGLVYGIQAGDQLNRFWEKEEGKKKILLFFFVLTSASAFLYVEQQH